jgi:hypothetical protein
MASRLEGVGYAPWGRVFALKFEWRGQDALRQPAGRRLYSHSPELGKLLVAQALHRIQLGGASGGQRAEDNSHHG